MEIREEEILRCSACCSGKQSCKSTNTDGSGVGIADEHDQSVMCISINQIEYTQDELIPVLKGNQASRNITLPQYLLIIFMN